MENKNTYTFHVNGMHCKSCVLVTESKIGEMPHVDEVKTDLASHTVRVVGDFEGMSDEEIAKELTTAVEKHGYTLSVDKVASVSEKKWSEFIFAIPLAVLFGVLFVGLQKAGLINLISADKPTYGTAFIIGIVASLSSCMAVVGGLVLSMSATFAKTGDRVKPQILFHIGRIVSFFVLGGVIGALGSAVSLNGTGTFLLSLIIGLVMFILGINLLDIFGFAKKLQPAMPKFLGSHAMNASKLNHALTPILVGIATFFLPCGFTQSMQIYALGTGSFITGALTMLFFALGTLPVLALLSFSSLSITGSAKSGIFFKTAGLIVIMFAVFNILNGLVAYGLISPLFNF
ncbi:MAG TPA: sulfite exporter TauE/SafE family protein [Candidatus Paceibacterota bacterium]|nr:sulfite exporter TauE/SafE family protein [Candidatus Paceibacterota bacterium]